MKIKKNAFNFGLILAAFVISCSNVEKKQT